MNSTPISQGAKLTFVVGVPGAGKTTWAKNIVSQDSSYILIDDPKTKPTFEPEVRYIITDPKLCYRKTFDAVNSLYPDSHWVFFKTDPMICWKNIQKRLEIEPFKIINLPHFIKFVREFESNLQYYLESVNTYQIEKLNNA